MAAPIIHAPPGLVRLAQPRTEAQPVKERDLSESARYLRERRLWKAVIEAECRRLEVFLKTCTFD